ncbi:hypothetical protein NUW58_g7320 [Xylaria curta]|uniref:Uncharacterized protein n=1 Tax=Xylaria curta TaxID=42375 RepID=A0ACC1NKV8_9PEZI|nr:hypothetical protein NUW58_g7320 [Xylaria curta]
MEHVVVWLGEAIPLGLWNFVRWVTFVFKLISLAFIVPIIGLIIFDFCLWLWRLYRPSLPADSRSHRLHRDYGQQPYPASNKASTAAIESEAQPQAAERRAAYRAVTDD